MLLLMLFREYRAVQSKRPVRFISTVSVRWNGETISSYECARANFYADSKKKKIAFPMKFTTACNNLKLYFMMVGLEGIEPSTY